MSLAGFWSEATDIMQEILNNWDTVSRRVDPVSLAGFKLQLIEILDKSRQLLGQVGQKSPLVTRQPDFVSTGKDKERVLQFETGCHWPAVTGVAYVGT